MIADISFFFTHYSTLRFPDEARFRIHINQLLQGKHTAWHTEFRNPAPCQIVQDSLEQIRRMSNTIREKQWVFEVKDVVNIGIGGSDLGPRFICDAFENLIDGPRVYFVSNLDTTQMQSVLKKLSPENTLFIVTSKSFKTLETIENMAIAKQWLIKHHLEPSLHLLAVTNNPSIAINAHQIPSSHVLSIPDWIIGRFSLWSAVSVPCAIAFGFEKFYQLHQGAHEMDIHFLHASIEENKPMQYALIMHDALIHQNLKALIILPYTQCLRMLPEYLQQLWMESLGKCVTTLNEPVNSATGPFVFGGVGTNSEHSLQQLMMQGTHTIFADFILPLQQVKMIESCLAQVKILREGVTEADLIKQIPGGKTANLLVFDTLNFKTLGALLAFYEHSVITLAFLLNINPFDQWGVECVKQKRKSLLTQLNAKINIEQIEKMFKSN